MPQEIGSVFFAVWRYKVKDAKSSMKDLEYSAFVHKSRYLRAIHAVAKRKREDQYGCIESQGPIV